MTRWPPGFRRLLSYWLEQAESKGWVPGSVPSHERLSTARPSAETEMGSGECGNSSNSFPRPERGRNNFPRSLTRPHSHVPHGNAVFTLRAVFIHGSTRGSISGLQQLAPRSVMESCTRCKILEIRSTVRSLDLWLALQGAILHQVGGNRGSYRRVGPRLDQRRYRPLD